MKKTEDTSAKISIYMGCTDHLTNHVITDGEIDDHIKAFQSEPGNNITVGVREFYLMSLHYEEQGYEIFLINYPRIMVDLEVKIKFMHSLAQFLLIECNQQYITVDDGTTTFVYENEHLN